MPTRHAVFVYGMLLPDAHDPATLADYRLAFDGHATIEPAEGETVLGGIIYCDDDYLRYLDTIEGEGSYYDRVRVLPDTEYDKIEAWVYIMRRDRQGHFNRAPSPSYVAMIQRGYERFGFDAARLHEAAQRDHYVSRA